MYDKNNVTPNNERTMSCFDSFCKVLPEIIDDEDFDNKVRFNGRDDECGSLLSFENPFSLQRDQCTIASLVDEVEAVAFVLGDECFDEHSHGEHVVNKHKCELKSDELDEGEYNGRDDETPYSLRRDHTISSLFDEIEEVAFILGDEYFNEHFDSDSEDDANKPKSEVKSDDFDERLALHEGIELILVDFANDLISNNAYCADDTTTSKHAVFVVGYQSNNCNYSSAELITKTDATTDDVSWKNGADAVSRCILAGVNLLKNIIDKKIKNVSHEIETQGEVILENIGSNSSNSEKCNELNDNTSLSSSIDVDVQESIKSMNEFTDEFLIYTTGSVKRGAEKLRGNTTNVLLGMRDIATNQIIELVDTMEEAELLEVIVPNEENREILAGLGKVTLTAAGAAGISFDVMFSSTEAGKCIHISFINYICKK